MPADIDSELLIGEGVMDCRINSWIPGVGYIDKSGEKSDRDLLNDFELEMASNRFSVFLPFQTLVIVVFG